MSTFSFHRLLAGVALAAAVSISGVALAQQQDDSRLDEAWKDALEHEEGILTPEQLAMLNNLAYQAAVTRVCDGFTLDQAKFSEGVVEAIAPSAEGLSEDEQREHTSAALVLLGTRFGLMLAEGNAEQADFCANAKEFKESPEDVPHYWQ